MSYTKILYSLAFLVSFLAGYTICSDATLFLPFGNNQSEINKTIKQLVIKKIKVADVINAHFEQQEQDIIKKLIGKYKISEQSWKAHIELYEKMLAKDPLYFPSSGPIINNPDDHIIVKKARELIVACGMNPNAITIQPYNFFSVASAGTELINNVPIHSLDLNIGSMAELNESEYSAIILHELMHLWYADMLSETLLIKSFPTLMNFYKEPLLFDFRKNREIRADIMGTISSTAYITSLINFYKKSGWMWDSDGTTHPTMSQRIKALQNLLNYLAEEKKLLLA